ncbi:MAG: hypothetical protein JKY18_09860 [Flavobacteriales bacterium]|nr:hypothetical protein [Flavobacteriales bacterium]
MAIMSRTLIVELDEEDPKEIKRLTRKEKKNPGVTAIYRNNIKLHNEALQEYLPKYWKLHDKIEFRKPAEVWALIKAKDENYAILQVAEHQEAQVHLRGAYTFSVYTFSIYLAERAKQIYRWQIDRVNEISDKDGKVVGAKIYKGKYVFKISLRSTWLSESDYHFVFKQFENNINQAAKTGKEAKIMRGEFYIPKIPAARINTLKTKTLLIPQEILHEEVTAKELGVIYKHPFEITTLAKEKDILFNTAESHAFIHYVWSDKHRSFLYMAVDATSGEILAVFSDGSLGFGFVETPLSSSDAHGLLGFRSTLAMGTLHFKGLNMYINKKTD